jgi:hypothetical protein
MPFFRLVLFFRTLFFDVVKLLALDSVLVLGLLGGVGDAGGKGSKEVGCVRHRGGGGRPGLEARKNVLAVEGGAPLCEFSIIQGD